MGVEPAPIAPAASPTGVLWSRSLNAARGATPGRRDGGGQGRAPSASEWPTMDRDGAGLSPDDSHLIYLAKLTVPL